MKGKQPDKTLAKVLFVLRDIYTRNIALDRQANRANDSDGIAEAQSAMLTCEEIAQELNIVLFSEAEKQQMEGR
jgi:hypothetical protein